MGASRIYFVVFHPSTICQLSAHFPISTEAPNHNPRGFSVSLESAPQTQSIPRTMSLQLLLPAPSSALAECEKQLSSQQTLRLVKIFLNASLGCICFVRGLLPSDSPAFQNRQVDDLPLTSTYASGFSYEDFVSFKRQLSADGDSQPFKILVRGKDSRSDHLLELVVSNVPILQDASQRKIRWLPHCLPHQLSY